MKNIGLSCYANSVTQCLKACIIDTYGFKIDNSLITGYTEDVREYYEKYIDKVPKQIRDRFIIRYKDGTKSTYAILSNKLSNGVGKIDKYNDFIVVYVCPDEKTLNPINRKISDISSLKITESGTSKILDEFKLVAGVCLSSSHYYALVNFNGKWFICNDEQVYESNINNPYPFYMLFYSKLKNT